MRASIIRKTPADLRMAPNLDATTRAGFSWAAMHEELARERPTG